MHSGLPGVISPDRLRLRFTVILMLRRNSLFLLSSCIVVASATAQRVLIPNSLDRTVMQFDGFDGSLVSTSSIDLIGLTSNLVTSPFEIIEIANGELWVSDQFADTVFRISPDGASLLGAAAGPLDGLRGLAPHSGGALLTNSGTSGGAPGRGLVEVDAMAGTTATFAGGIIGNPFDAEPFQFNGVDGFLVSDITNEDIVFVEAANPANQQIFHDSDGLTGINFPEQVHVSDSGRVFVAGFSPPAGIYEYDPTTGAEINYIDTSALGVTSLRGMHELGNGNLMVTNGSGVYVYDITAGTIATIVMGVDARFISDVSDGPVGTAYCMSNPNSTGSVGALTAQGSTVVAADSVTLIASSLPPLSFGFFITSQTQGFVMNPGGSDGNLCLAGSIGRYVGIGQIQNTGTAGTFNLALDLTQVPQPTGFVSVNAGETWNFQSWFRDSSPAGPTSNFTQGLEIDFQ